MGVSEELQQYANDRRAEFKEKKGTMSLSLVVAEKKGLLSKKKVRYEAKVKPDESSSTLKLFEAISESSAGAGGGLDDYSGSRGFEKELDKLRKKYEFQTDPADIRGDLDRIAERNGLTVESVKSARKLK